MRISNSKHNGSGTPIYRQVYEYVREIIVSKQYNSSRRLPSDAQLMRQFKTSRTTVAKAMRDLEMAGLIHRRPGSGSYAKDINLHCDNVSVALLVAGLGDSEFFEPICAQIAQSCQKYKLSLIWGTTKIEYGTNVNAIIQRCLNQEIKGVFFAPDELPSDSSINTNKQIADALFNSGITVILLDRDIVPFPERSKYDLIGIDNFRVGYMQTKYLVQCDCHRVLYFTRPCVPSTMAVRFNGYQYAIQEACCTKIPLVSGDASDKEFCKWMYKKYKPDGIVCFNDPLAVQLLQTCQELRIDVPEKVKVIGVDDIKYSKFIPVPLTTLQQPCKEIGTHAVEMMMQHLTGFHPVYPKQILFDPKIVVRKSCEKN